MQKVKKALPKRQKSSSLVLALPAAGAISSLPSISTSGLIFGAPLALAVGSLAYGLGEDFNRKNIRGRKEEVPTNRETVTASDNTRVARPMIFPESVVNRSKAQARAAAESKDSSDVTPRDSSRVTPTNNGQAGSGGDNPKKGNWLKERLQKAKERASNIVKSKGTKIIGGAALGGAADYGRILTENSYGNNLDWQDMVLPSMAMPVLESGLSSETQQLRELERQQRKAESLKNQRERIEQLKQKSPVINKAPQQNTEQTNFENALRSIINDADSLTK